MADSANWNEEAWTAALKALGGRELWRPIRAYLKGDITGEEALSMAYEQCYDKPEVAAEFVRLLRQHPDKGVCSIGESIEEFFRQRAAQIKDIEQVRRVSPLQPGTRLVLSGGYAHPGPPRWLDGRPCYKATFLAFAERGADKMPAALVRLDEPIDMVEGGGQRHRGQFALLKLWHVANWEETETVVLHVVEALPEDVEQFYATHPFGTEIETHVTYAIDREPDR
jgi:hypothetical protein